MTPKKPRTKDVDKSFYPIFMGKWGHTYFLDSLLLNCYTWRNRSQVSIINKKRKITGAAETSQSRLSFPAEKLMYIKLYYFHDYKN